MKTKTLLLVAAFGLGSFSINATPLLTETFSYADGSLVGNGTWNTHSGTTPGQVLVSSGTVSVNDTDTEDVNATFSEQTSGTIFFGVDVSAADPGSYTNSDNEYFIHFKDGTTSGFSSRVETSLYSATGYRLGISTSSSTDATWATDLNYGETYRLIVGYDFTSGVSTLWVNPTDASSTNIITTGTQPGATVSSIALRQSSATPDYDITMDNLLVGTTFADVLAIPEPSMVALLLIGAGFLFRYVRKK